MKRTGQYATCPTEGHGPLVDLDGRLYCSNQEHDGRPASHPLGFTPRTSPFPGLPAPVERPRTPDPLVSGAEAHSASQQSPTAILDTPSIWG